MEWTSLTFPRYRYLLEGEREDTTVLRIEEDGPAAMALLYHAPAAPLSAALLSITVVRHLRRRGLARTLLKRAEASARERGCTEIFARYSSRLPGCQGLERLVSSSGWSTPEILEFRTAGYAVAGAAEMARLEPAGRPYFPPGATVELYSNLGEEDLATVDSLEAAIDFTRFIHPKLYLKHAHPELCLALRHEGRVAGWVLGAKSTNDSYVYHCGYVIPELRRRGALVGLIREVCQRQAALFGPESVAQLSTTAKTPGMAAFMRRRLGPCSLWHDEFRSVSKRLIATAES
jgi:GNAT superfamily N-acetyltransferase